MYHIMLKAETNNSSQALSWMNSKLEVKNTSLSRKGVFAKEKINKNERVAIFGGKVMTEKEVLKTFSPMLTIMGITGLIVIIIGAKLFPLV